jgi:ribosomal protein S18 acetylase RimI-like enzyme
MTLVVRRAQLTDVPSLGELWQELAEIHASFAPEWEIVPGAAAMWRAHASQMLGQVDRCVLVAELDGTLVGFIIGQITSNPPTFRVKRTGHVNDAIVTSSVRRRGVGEALFEALQSWFKEKRITIVHLSAAIANSEGQAFWHKMGFQDQMSRMRGEFQ